jgi:hypothetical protein
MISCFLFFGRCVREAVAPPATATNQNAAVGNPFEAGYLEIQK